MLTALVLDSHGRRTEALKALADAFAEPPEPDGYTRLFLDEGEPLRKLLRDAWHRGVADRHPARVLAEPDSPTPRQALVGQTLLDPLSERELQVLAPPRQRAARTRDRPQFPAENLTALDRIRRAELPTQPEDPAD
jgi:hypothetical protein